MSYCLGDGGSRNSSRKLRVLEAVGTLYHRSNRTNYSTNRNSVPIATEIFLAFVSFTIDFDLDFDGESGRSFNVYHELTTPMLSSDSSYVSGVMFGRTVMRRFALSFALFPSYIYMGGMGRIWGVRNVGTL